MCFCKQYLFNGPKMPSCNDYCNLLTHWGRVTHICVSRLTITGSDNGLSPGRRQAIIWTSAGIMLIGPLGTNFIENLSEILTLSFTKIRLKVSSAKWRPFRLGLNVLLILAWCHICMANTNFNFHCDAYMHFRFLYIPGGEPTKIVANVITFEM